MGRRERGLGGGGGVVKVTRAAGHEFMSLTLLLGGSHT